MLTNYVFRLATLANAEIYVYIERDWFFPFCTRARYMFIENLTCFYNLVGISIIHVKPVVNRQ